MPSKAELEIAGFYDGIYLFYGAANSFLTLGLDRWWRARAAAAARRALPEARSALDVCCGTGDFLLALGKEFGPGLRLTGADLSAAMLSVAGTRLPGVPLIRTAAGELPFPDGSFDLVTISFATRNLFLDKENLLAALREFRRVLRPGGVFLNLETTRPAGPAVWFFMRAYVKTVIGLLNLQAGQRQKGAMSDFLNSTLNRVRSMALIHENLYLPENLAQLNLTNYLKHLCASLLQSAGPVSANVRIESQVENKSISIGQNQAVPFGLLINELVTNALKYAFPEERKGLIRVTVQSPASEKVLLTVADDGVGLPAGLDPRHAEGLGLKLVCLLAKQLHGTVNFDRGQGTAVQILFNTLAEAEETTHE